MTKHMTWMIALLLAMTLVLSACGGEGGSGETTPTTAAPASAAPTTVPTTTPTTEALEAGLEGVGEKAFDTPFFTMTIPADVKYELYTYAVNEDDNRGTIQIDFGPDSTLQARFHVSTTRMVSSLDAAHDEYIRTQNLDTYDEGRYEDLDDVTFGGVTYKVMHVTTEWDDEIALVTYYARESDGVDVYAECVLSQDGNDAVSLTDDFIVSAMNSVSYK